MKIELVVNNVPVEVEVDGQTPLLWVLRDYLDLKGTKFGCGKAACGACTILLDDTATRCCTYPVSLAAGKRITTIEGLSSDEGTHPVKQAWTEEVVPQCGYCQPGFMMATASLLLKSPAPTDDEIDQNIINICRCGTYFRMRKAIHRAAEITEKNNIAKNTEESDS